MAWSPQQEKALRDTGHWLSNPGGPQVFRIFGYAGTGKTTLALELAQEVKGRVLYGAYTGKASLVLQSKGCKGASTIHSMIYKADDKGGKDVKFNLDPDSPLRGAGLVILDECFVAGTLIDLPGGGSRPIEQMQVGDHILNAIGSDTVSGLYSKEVTELVEVKSRGHSFKTSTTHRFLTQRGFKSARELEPGDTLVGTRAALRSLRGQVQSKNADGTVLFPELLSNLQLEFTQLGRSVHTREGSKVWRREEEVALFGRPKGAGRDRVLPDNKALNQAWLGRESQPNDEGEGAHLQGSGREWTADNSSPEEVVRCTGRNLDPRVCSDNRNPSRRSKEDPKALQAGPGTSGPEDLHRDRWYQPPEPASQREGHQEDRFPLWDRVDSVEILQSTDTRLDPYRDANGVIRVYDLKAAQHSTFSVGGFLVHNCSMIDEPLALDLLSFGTRVLVLGDPAQLPPIKGEGYFTGEPNPEVMLTEVHRQAADNPIIRMSMDVREGRKLTIGRHGGSQVLQYKDIDPAEVRGADQILVGRNKTRHNYNRRMRELMGRKGVLPEEGDKLVCLKNDKERGLLNGGLWRLARPPSLVGDYVRMVVRPEEGGERVNVSVRTEFFTGGDEELDWREKRNTDQFTYGYALTVHKSQGSQWDNVFLFDESSIFREHKARWLYTGITRAAERVTIAV